MTSEVIQRLPIENVQDYPRPPALQKVPQRVTVHFGGQMIVSSDRALRVLETHHAPTYYVPRDDVRAELTRAHGASFCEWKGAAQYWTVRAGGQVAPRAAWSYPDPTGRFRALGSHIAFYSSLMDLCQVGEAEVTPQPGDFYGGWVTDNLQGIVKGGPGTRHW